MQTLSTTRTAVLLVIVMVTAGCGARATGSVGLPSDQGTEAPPASSTTSTTTAGAEPGGGAAESTGPNETPQISSSTTAPDVAAAPQLAVDDIDLMIDGVDATLAELDQLLNNLAAALAAEEGEIIP